MMSYKILLHPKAANSLKKLNISIQQRIKEKLKALEKNPEAGGKLSMSQFWKLRAGDYRAIYEIDRKEKQIIVLFIGHRRKVYDDFMKLL